MGRKPVVVEEADGTVDVRVKVPRSLWLVAKKISDEYGMRQTMALMLLLKRLGDAFTDQRRTSIIAQLLGPDVIAAISAAREENFGALETGAQIDISKLHRNPKLKSGYHGVYQDGRSWRAEGRALTGGIKSLGHYQTPELAAWIRFMYYETNDLPYGYWEVVVDELRARMGGSDAELIHEQEQTNTACGQDHLNALPGRPKNPSTYRPGFPSTAPVPSADDGNIDAEIEAMRASNDDAIRARQIKKAGEN